MTNKKYLLKIGLVLGVLVLSFVALPSFHKANAIICDTCGGGGGGGGVTIPVAPTLNSVSAGSSGQVSVNFTDNSTNETGFYVYRGGALVATLAAIANSGTASVYTDTGMACGSTYSYNVSSYNSAGSASSATLSVAVKCPPTAPTINSYGATGQNSVSFTWTSTSVIDYSYLFRDSVLFGSAPQTGVNGTSYTSVDSGLACGSTHTYFVRVGNGLNTADSVLFSIKTPGCVSAPAAVTSPIITPVSGVPSVNTSWSSTASGIYMYLKGPSGYSLVGIYPAGGSSGIGGLRCPYSYTAYYVAYNTDSSVSGTDTSCASALTNAGISGPAAPTGAKCAAATSKASDIRFCTQQFLGQ